MTAPTAADYAAALATMGAYHFEGIAPEAALFGAMLTYTRARLVADVALERYIERGRDTKAGVVTTDRATWDALDEECERADKAALDAYRAFVALAANADGAP